MNGPGGAMLLRGVPGRLSGRTWTVLPPTAALCAAKRKRRLIITASGIDDGF
jgi:hypothetical protein